MKKVWDPIIKSAEDIQKTANRLLDDGLCFFRTTLGSIPLLSSSEAIIGGERDETHYFLVPCLDNSKSYVLYRTRRLPEGVGPENELPKNRIFQLPTLGARDHLIKLLTQQLKDEQIKNSDIESPLANRLDTIAEEIDRQSNLVSGGLLLIGGAVAIANPLLGIGIAAKSLLPSLGSKLSIHGIKHGSDWLQSRKKQSLEKDSEKRAQSEVKKLKPETRENEILALLEKALYSPDGQFDPMFESKDLLADHSQMRDLKLAAQALNSVYQDRNALSPSLSLWLDHIDELAFASP